MKLENQVCTLSQAKRLRELGVNQNSLYYWDPTDGELYRSVDRTAKDIGCVSAFTAAELGVLLPVKYFTQGDNDPDGKHCFTCWGFYIEDADDAFTLLTEEWFYNEAEARAYMLIEYLKDRNKVGEGIVELNNRLEKA